METPNDKPATYGGRDYTTMTSKHTPGPWTLDKRATTAVQAGDKHIAMVNFSFLGRPEKDVYGEEHDANAQLIAAAPDLLEALQAYQEANRLRHDGDALLYQLAENAIAKATGENAE